ncbi:MAG: hypothetical protein HRU19_09215 [Pseudobacteriovorax sp.]|nr:hypothetical protein [Pseudobacteriovorax sp.]
MLDINLTPVEELENPYWFIGDLLVLLIAVVASIMGIQFYLGIQEEEILEIQSRTELVNGNLRQIQGEARQYDDLNQKVTRLESKKNSLFKITESKLIRYQPVILIETLQNIKPKGLWFSRIAFVREGETPLAQQAANAIRGARDAGAGQNTDQTQNQTQTSGEGTNQAGQSQEDGNGGAERGLVNTGLEIIGQKIEGDRIEIEGFSFSKIIIGEFMSSIKATANQEYDPSDVRTQLYFDRVEINYTEISSGPQANQGRQLISSFKIVVSYKEKNSNDFLEGNLTSYSYEIEDSMGLARKPKWK